MCVYKNLSLSNYCHLVLIVIHIPLIHHDIVLQYKLSTCMAWIWVSSTVANAQLLYHLWANSPYKKKYTNTQRPIRLKHFEFENKTSDIILLNSWGNMNMNLKKHYWGSWPVAYLLCFELYVRRVHTEIF